MRTDEGLLQRGSPECYDSTVPEWRNWQTQWTQNPPDFGPCRFDSYLGHQPRCHSVYSVCDQGRVGSTTRFGTKKTLFRCYSRPLRPRFSLLKPAQPCKKV
jgi:hypothetical protein